MKAVILIGGPSKGTRFRPLSLDIPKPLFPIAGLPMIQHHVEACKKVACVSEVLIIGSYNAADIQPFADEMSRNNGLVIRYLQEFTPLGTAGAMYHFRDQIRVGGEDSFFVFNGDVCADFPLEELLQSHKILNNEGCVAHYVEKPSTFVSTLISCGVYVASNDIFQTMSDVFYSNQPQEKQTITNGYGKDSAYISLEQHIMAKLIKSGKLFALPVKNWWSQVKTAGSAIYVNRHYLALYRQNKPERLASASNSKCQIIDDVYIHPSASIHPTAVLGPNVSIGANVTIGAGVRIRETIVMENSTIQAHSIVLYSIVGKDSLVGEWARVEGTPCDPNPDKPFAKMENQPLFNIYGQLNPSATILGSSVSLASEKYC